jgi:hypothetical protein
MFILDLYNIFNNIKKPINKYNPKYNTNSIDNKLNANLVSSLKYNFISFSDKYNDMCIKNNIRQKIKKLCIKNNTSCDNENNNVSLAIIKQSKVNAVICIVSIILVKYFFLRM